MVRLDIVAGLKNAVERGYSLDQAKQTLKNSGYSEQDIQEAANYLTGGQVNIQQSQQDNYRQSPQQNYPQDYQQYQYQEQTHHKKFPFLLVFLLLILFVLASFLVLSIVFKEELVILFKNLFG